MARPRSVTGTLRRSIGSGWEFASAVAGCGLDALGQLDWKPATAPNTAAGALRDLGAWDWDTSIDFDAVDWWWRVRLDAENAPVGAVVLGFDGLATLADVWLDREHLLRSDNMFVMHELPLELDGQPHELLIRCAALAPDLAKKRPRPRWRVPMLTHAQLRWFRTTLLGRTPGWSPPCPAVGPWRPVWMEKRALNIGETVLRNRVEGDDGVVELAIELGDDVVAARLLVERAEQRASVALHLDGGRWRGGLTVAGAKLWWPHTHGDPARYRVAVEVHCRGENLTIELGHAGFRTIEIERGNGDFAVRVNGVDIFCRGACWTPLDVVRLTATPQALREAMAQVCAAGMNMLRVGGTMVYEDEAFHDALDEHGILLWQDLMFANMDYPEDEAFVAGVLVEVDQQLARLQGRPSLAVVCGNSEVEQQAAMGAAARELWSPGLFHRTIAARVEALGIPYVTSSAHGGAFPHAANAGTSSYYGVGAYLRPLDDARRSELVFATECLAFANIPGERGLPGGPGVRVHHPAWKARSPRDLGAGWDFDDVRDHYVGRLFGVDPAALRVSDHDRYLALGRVATGEVMARAFAEWRRERSPTRGALIWFLRDLWPGAGWGLIDAHGVPKPAWWIARHALLPLTLAITDEGTNGLALQIANDRATAVSGSLDLTLWRGGAMDVGRMSREVTVSAHSTLELPAATMFDYFADLSWAYRFGPPMAHAIHATFAGATAWWFPAGIGSEHGLGSSTLSVEVHGNSVRIHAAGIARHVAIDLPGWLPSDNYFHLAPGDMCSVSFEPVHASGRPRGTITALNSDAVLRFELEHASE